MASEKSRSTPRSARLLPWLDEEFLRHAGRLGCGPSLALERVVAEWWTQNAFPSIEFRWENGRRAACLKGGPTVPDLVRVLEQEFAGSVVHLIQQGPWRDIEEKAIDDALACVECFPEMLDA